MNKFEKIIEHPIFQQAMHMISDMEKDRVYCRHGFEHLVDVSRILYIEVLEKHLEYSKDVVYAAGLLHDIGKYQQYEDGTPHHIASTRLAEKILIDTGYKEWECLLVLNAVYQHRTAGAEENSLDALLYKADKSSRPCYFCGQKESCYWTEERKNKALII